MLNHPNSFVQMAVHAIIGSLLGLTAGLVIGFIIMYIGGLIPPFTDASEGPHQIAPFLGMGFGSVIGALLGGLVGTKR